MSLNNGDVSAGYTIVKRLGSGGMGEVYLAQHPRLPRRDAFKVLPAALTADHGFRQRFSRAPKTMKVSTEIIRKERIAPAVHRDEWARAAVAAANGLEAAG
jgi:serine/threonine protein kinase